MNVKEHGTWLSVVGFFQLVAMATFGFFINEVQKPDWNRWLTLASFSSAVIVCELALKIYLMVFKKVRKRKK